MNLLATPVPLFAIPFVAYLLGSIPYGLRVAVHRPSARPRTLIRPLAVSPSIHPARIALALSGFAPAPCHISFPFTKSVSQ